MKLPVNVTRTLTKIWDKTSAHAPEILVIGGILGAIGATVLACKATTKLDEVIDKYHSDVDAAKEIADDTQFETYSEEDYEKDKRIYMAHTAVDIAKLYAPAATVGLLAITAILVSTGILKKRNIALAAACTSISETFKDYRDRVADRFGTEIEKQIRYNLVEKTVEEKTIDEDGEETTVTKKVVVAKAPTHDNFSRIFDEYNRNWKKNAALNKSFLIGAERFANDRLQANGRLYLNEVYKLLGFEPSEEGQIVGWVLDYSEDSCNDNYVDFGMFDLENPNVNAFVNEEERSVLLNFNVDGCILSCLNKRDGLNAMGSGNPHQDELDYPQLSPVEIY